MSLRFLSIPLVVVALVTPAAAQTARGTTPVPAAPAQPEPQRDSLGRSTPRGALLGFFTAARRGDDGVARLYLNTTRTGAAAEELAHQLFVVLDARLPARFTQVSDSPEGSRSNPLAPDEERIGAIAGADGPFDVVLERIERRGELPIWVFSKRTLDPISAAYAEITAERDRDRSWLPRFLIDSRVANVRLYEWLTVLLGLPAFYFVTVLLNRALSAAWLLPRRRRAAAVPATIHNVLPLPARLLLLTVATRWAFSRLPLSLLVRQVLTHAATLIAIGAVTWLLVLLDGELERYLVRRVPPANYAAAVSLLRVGRRAADMLIVLTGVLAILRHFGVDATPLLAGLGVGGIAVALAAQKTLENIIAGASLIFDQAVRVGDFLKAGELQGTVDHIGLRSTRIRTLDRSIVSVPNSQIANMSLETLSARDKFWFHPVVGLRYETTTDQMRLVLEGIRQMLVRTALIDADSVRVRFLKLGAFSLDVEIFAYVLARDWNHFLEIQEGLLLRITEIVQASGTEIAFPSQTMYLSGVNAATSPVRTPN